jgi:Spy/CpxP family protein refolding chaperone
MTMWIAAQKLAAAVLILTALTAAGCAQTTAYAPIPPDQTESKGGGGGY